MPAIIDLSSEAAVTDIVTSNFVASVQKNLGFDASTDAADLPVDIEELLHECIQICEREQWRFILTKSVTLLLPFEALCKADGLIFLPFGPVTALDTFTYINEDGDATAIDAADYTIYPGEPAKLWAQSWVDLVDDIDVEQPYPITIEYTTGYATYDDVPKPTIRALKILAYHLFEYRDAISDGSVSELPQGYCQLRDLNLLNDKRAIKYVAEDWSKVSRG
jgi:uncharacterized phiE125 gp8 family phage protein